METIKYYKRDNYFRGIAVLILLFLYYISILYYGYYSKIEDPILILIPCMVVLVITFFSTIFSNKKLLLAMQHQDGSVQFKYYTSLYKHDEMKIDTAKIGQINYELNFFKYYNLVIEYVATNGTKKEKFILNAAPWDPLMNELKLLKRNIGNTEI